MTVQLNAPSEKKKAELSMHFTDFRCQELAGKKFLPKTIDGEYRFVLPDSGKEYIFAIIPGEKYCAYKKDGLILRRRLIRKVWIVWKKYLIRRQQYVFNK